MNPQVYRSKNLLSAFRKVLMCFAWISEQAAITSLYVTEFCNRDGACLPRRSELYIYIKLRLFFKGLFIYKNKYRNSVQDSDAVFIDTTIYRVFRNDCRGLTTCHLVLQMQPHMISFYGVTLRIRFMFLLFPQVPRN